MERPLSYEQIEVPPLPLIEKATSWGINVKTVPGNYRYYGSYSMTRKEIASHPLKSASSSTNSAMRRMRKSSESSKAAKSPTRR